jgi:hypothetical protein
MRLLIIICLIFLVSSCGEKLFTANVNCDECYYPEPDSADIEIKVTINEEFKKVPLVFYKGDVEDNQVIYRDTATSSTHYLYWVPVNHPYSVKAEYKRNGSVLYAIDGTKVKTARVSDACDGECFVIQNDVMDVEIKKDFSDF